MPLPLGWVLGANIDMENKILNPKWAYRLSVCVLPGVYVCVLCVEGSEDQEKRKACV